MRITYFGRLVRECLSEETTFEQSPGGGEGMSHVDICRDRKKLGKFEEQQGGWWEEWSEEEMERLER